MNYLVCLAVININLKFRGFRLKMYGTSDATALDIKRENLFSSVLSGSVVVLNLDYKEAFKDLCNNESDIPDKPHINAKEFPGIDINQNFFTLKFINIESLGNLKGNSVEISPKDIYVQYASYKNAIDNSGLPVSIQFKKVKNANNMMTKNKLFGKSAVVSNGIGLLYREEHDIVKLEFISEKDIVLGNTYRKSKSDKDYSPKYDTSPIGAFSTFEVEDIDISNLDITSCKDLSFFMYFANINSDIVIQNKKIRATNLDYFISTANIRSIAIENCTIECKHISNLLSNTVANTIILDNINFENKIYIEDSLRDLTFNTLVIKNMDLSKCNTSSNKTSVITNNLRNLQGIQVYMDNIILPYHLDIKDGLLHNFYKMVVDASGVGNVHNIVLKDIYQLGKDGKVYKLR